MIRKSLLAFSILLSPAIASATPDLGDYTIAFSDEFDGVTLDPEKWNTGYLWGPYLPINNEEQLYVDVNGMHSNAAHSPFELTGDSLIIRAIPTTGAVQPPVRPAESDPVWNNYAEYRFNGPSDSGDDPGYQPENVNYLSGLITSYDAFRFTHGYAEARVKLPAGQGLWPAFWLSTSFYVEDVPEIDIMEFLGHDTDTVYHTYHYFEPLNDWRGISTPSFTTDGPDFTDDWHTFSLAWGPKEIVWYVDGVETRKITDAEYDIANQAMYVLANLAVGGDWPGSPDDSTVFPAEYEIDYIRVYEKNAPAVITQEALDQQYVLMFSDEFEESGLDTSKWNTHHLWGPYWQINNELQFYPDVGDTHSSFTPSPITVNGDGLLTITARPLDNDDLPAMLSDDFQGHPEWQFSEAYNNPDFYNPPQGDPNHDASKAAKPFIPEYASGILTTYDSFKFVNGYAEITAKLPQGDGIWPAFWLLNGYYVDQQPEIDVIEMRGENPKELIHSYHLTPRDGGPPFYTWSSFSDSPDGFADDFHTYGIAWQPGRLDWYIDGVKVHTHEGADVSSQNMYVILNLAVGGNFNFVDVDPSVLPQSMEVSSVKVYQLATDIPLIENRDVAREQAISDIISGLEAYAATTGSYRVDGGGFNGGGQGWFHYEGGQYTQSIANTLVSGEYLSAPVPTDPLLANPGSISGFDFLVYRCQNRIAVFSRSDGIVPDSDDSNWWSENNCPQSAITAGHSYFQVSSEPATGNRDVEREQAVSSVIAGLEAYGAATGTYRVAGSGFNGGGQGWFHYQGGKYTQSIANALVNGGYLSAPVPTDPLLLTPGSISSADFLVYRCQNRIGVFSLSEGIEPSAEDSSWWTDNNCTQSAIAAGHPYFQVSGEPAVGNRDADREQAISTIIAALEAYSADTGSYRVDGGGFNGGGQGWFYYEGGKYTQSVANTLVSGGYLSTPVPTDPLLLTAGSLSSADFLIYRCQNRVGVFSLSEGIEPSEEDSAWWSENNCTQSAIGSGHPYFQVSAEPAVGDRDANREEAVGTVIAGLEAYYDANGTYRVAGGGFNGGGQGWFHFEGGKYVQSVANALLEDGHLTAPTPADPLLTNPGALSSADFLVYRCQNRVGVFSLSEGAEPSTEDSAWWSENNCPQAPISAGHPYFQLSQER